MQLLRLEALREYVVLRWDLLVGGLRLSLLLIGLLKLEALLVHQGGDTRLLSAVLQAVEVLRICRFFG